MILSVILSVIQTVIQTGKRPRGDQRLGVRWEGQLGSARHAAWLQVVVVEATAAVTMTVAAVVAAVVARLRAPLRSPSAGGKRGWWLFLAEPAG